MLIQVFIKADFSNLDLDASIEEYESIMRDTLDMHAPLKCKVKKVRASNPWFNDEIRSARKVRRQLERKWMRSRLEVDRQEFCKQRRIVNKLVDKAETAYYSAQVDDCKGDQGKLFKIVNTLLHKSKGRECVLPTRKSDRELADTFSNYFYEKKIKIFAVCLVPLRIIRLLLWKQVCTPSLCLNLQVRMRLKQ